MTKKMQRGLFVFFGCLTLPFTLAGVATVFNSLLPKPVPPASTKVLASVKPTITPKVVATSVQLPPSPALEKLLAPTKAPDIFTAPKPLSSAHQKKDASSWLAPDAVPAPATPIPNDEELGKQKRAAFDKNLPGAVAPYVAFIEIWTPEEPNAVRVRLEKTWDDLSLREQSGATNILAGAWFDTVREHPGGSGEPTLWLFDPKDNMVGKYTPTGEQ